MSSKDPSRPRHAPFDAGFAYAALFLALVPGFGLAALLAGRLGWGGTVPANWTAMVQAHGHAQVFGWLGLFIMGVALSFMPRFSGVPLATPRVAAWIWRLVLVGVAGRCLAQALPGSPPALLGLSALAETGGILLYVGLQARTLHATALAQRHQAIVAVRPFFAATLLGWAATALLGGSAALAAAWQGRVVVDPGWNALSLDLFVGLVLLPVAFVFAFRTFPLYLRLPAPTWPIGRLAAVYLAAVALEWVPMLAQLLGYGHQPSLPAVGGILKGLAVLYLIVRLDLLTRRQMPWTAGRQGHPPTNPKMHRKPRSLPDYGEFGRFEWLLYGAFVWLTVAACIELYNGLGVLTGGWDAVAADILRHIYLGGFATLLLLGMAPRMIPGFVHRRGVAFPALVTASFYLGATAVLLRVAALPMGRVIPWEGWNNLFGFSGLLGWSATALLAFNLWMTLQRPAPSTQKN